MIQMLSIARKELKAYFGSPMAAIFIGVFLLSSLFSFFWLETFFSRNIADIRPLFRWMPLLMIFLTAALTMRQWSEEQRVGTLEILLTLPVSISQLVLGKFLAVLALVAISLSLTAGLPITVSLLGNIDWGPVIGGYLGTLLMASAYISIGLFVSSRTDNQIIALMSTVLLCALFYLVGSPGITSFMGHEHGNLLQLFGTGSRFLSIERGVIDLRDLVYYLSITVLFLFVNGYSLERKRWSNGHSSAGHRRSVTVTIWLVALNILALNLWLNAINTLRLDLTEEHEYSISQQSLDLVENLQEPLILIGYFSEKTHPLLSPLVPRIKDFMTEYAAVSGGRVTVSFVDPRFDEEAEREANQQYGIKPVPFQVAGRYEAGVVNSYFNVLILYGDQYVTLGFDDLIEVQHRGDGQLDVRLRNFEYDLSKSIKKAVYGFQSLDAVFAGIDKEINLNFIVSQGVLPESLAELPEQVEAAAGEVVKDSGGKLTFQKIDPDDPESPMNREDVVARFGIEPLALSFYSDETLYLHLILTVGENIENIFLRPDMASAEVRMEIEAALKRSGSGFLKTIGIWTPPEMAAQFGMQQPQSRFSAVKELLRENYNVEDVDLSNGGLPGDIDVLLLIAPQQMGDIERFAVDQHLMRGGSVVALAATHVLDLQPGMQSLNLKKVERGMGDMLSHYGVTIEDALVMDTQNEPFPIPVSRDIGGLVIQEIMQLDYPFFVDVRREGMSDESPITASLGSVTMNWASPLTIAENVKAAILLQSSPDSWLHYGTEIQPDFNRYPQLGFPIGEDVQGRVLAVSLHGAFSSYFNDREDPRRERAKPETDDGENMPGVEADEQQASLPINPLIRKTSSARLVVVGSAEFISDPVISISQSVGKDRFMNGLAFLQNAIDWSVEDEGLLGIRSRGAHTRLLYPQTRREQVFWEWLNYGIGLLALALVSYYGARRRRREEPLVRIDPGHAGTELENIS